MISFPVSRPTSPPVPKPTQTGVSGVIRKVWTKVPGNKPGKLQKLRTFPRYPDITETLGKMDVPVNQYDNYGQQLIAFYVPKYTGPHKFYLAADDFGQLFVSRDSSPRNKKSIARVTKWTGYRQFNRYVTQSCGYWIRLETHMHIFSGWWTLPKK